MIVEIIPCLSDNYSYLIFEKKTGTVSIVDPSDFETCDQIIKKYKKLDYILNTHHHLDHVSGNLELKNKYNSRIIGYDGDKDRIPGIDIVLRENQDFKIGNLKFKVFFVPGHTSGHIAFYFKKENIIFTGDTLFSLGCGRIFEGTNEQMFDSLNKFKDLPGVTKIYCGHEYTRKNLDFCSKYDVTNSFLIEKSKEVDHKLSKNLPTIPTTISDEFKTNIFLRCDDVRLKEELNKKDLSDLEIFTYLRGLKDNF